MGVRVAYAVTYIALLVAVIVVFVINTRVRQNEVALVAHDAALQRQHDILERSIIAQCRVLNDTVLLHKEEARRDEQLLAFAIRLYTGESAMAAQLHVHVTILRPTALRSRAKADAAYAGQITRIGRLLKCTPVIPSQS